MPSEPSQLNQTSSIESPDQMPTDPRGATQASRQEVAGPAESTPQAHATPPPRLSVFTLFPQLVEVHGATSVLGRAQVSGLIEIAAHDLRSHGVGVHQAVDDAPFGGGAGMVLAPGPIFDAVEARLVAGTAHRPVFLLGPSGRQFNQNIARELAELVTETGGLSFLCGRYEGFDQRIHDHLVDGELSLGDFVLGGGEVAAMAMIEAIARLLPGVMGNKESAEEESFSTNLLEYPQYTRPAEFRGWAVPDVLRSGDHARVARWRRAEAIARTLRRRPDLLQTSDLTKNDEKILREFGLFGDFEASRATEGVSSD